MIIIIGVIGVFRVLRVFGIFRVEFALGDTLLPSGSSQLRVDNSQREDGRGSSLHIVFANVRNDTRVPGKVCNKSAAASSVAPVVQTSSTRRTCLPARRSG